jgi:hypothetical protein
MVRSRLITLVAALAFTGAALGQYGSSNKRSLTFSKDAEQGIAQAKRTQLPLMFLVIGDGRERDERLDEPRRKALMDDRVIYAARRFIPVQVVRSDSRLRSLFAKLNVPTEANMDVVFATPDGDRIDTFSALHVPDTFAQKMTLVFNNYRNQLFQSEIKPKLEDRGAKSADVKKALKVIAEFTIESAAPSVLKALDDWKTDAGVVKEALSTLGELSTPDAVKKLWEIADDKANPNSRAAAEALEKATPVAAEQMLERLNTDNVEERAMVYGVIAKIVGLSNPKPERFWSGPNQRVQQQELDRVAKAVERAARKWRDGYANYR